MAKGKLKTVRRGAPATKLVTPIPGPEKKGVQDAAYRQQLVQRSNAIPAPQTGRDNGYGTGSSVAGATGIKGGVV